MLVSLKHQFAFFSNPKCATTSIEQYLTKHCEISINSTKFGKHVKPRDFTKLSLFLESQCNITSIKKICTARHPIDKIISWYAYRSRPKLKNSRPDRYLGNINFKSFCRAQMQRNPINFFYNFTKSKFEVDFIIPIEHLKSLEIFFQKTFKDSHQFSRKNASLAKNAGEIAYYKEIALAEFNNATNKFRRGVEIYDKILNHYNDSSSSQIIKVNKIF